METSREIIQQELRAARAKTVDLILDDNNQTFTVYGKKGETRYKGKVSRNRQDDFCECPSFEYGDTPTYKAEHGYNFRCKHLICAADTLIKRLEGVNA